MKECPICKMEMIEEHQILLKDKKGESYCHKQCIDESIDIFNPETFIKHLEKMDYPFFEREWKRILTNRFMKNPFSVFGVYITTMNLKGYKAYTFNDSEYNKPLKDKRYRVSIDERYVRESNGIIIYENKEEHWKGENNENL